MLRLLISTVFAAFSSVAYGNVTYDEAVSGDLGNNPNNVAPFVFDIGTNTVRGTQSAFTSGQLDLDSFNFLIAPNSVVNAVTVTLSDLSGDIGLARWVLTLRSSPQSVIGRVGGESPGNYALEQVPLNVNNYSILASELGFPNAGGGGVVAYLFTFQVGAITPVPENSSLALMGLGLFGLIMAAQRRSMQMV